MPDGGLVSTKGIENRGARGEGNRIIFSKIIKRAVLSWYGPSFMRKPLRYKESKIGKTIGQGFCLTIWHFYIERGRVLGINFVNPCPKLGELK